MANILVAGGAGFIGSHTVLALAEARHTIVVLDDLSNGHADSVLSGTLVKGQLSDGDLLDRIFADHSIDAVIHFAAYIEAGESVKSPLSFYENNVSGTLSLLQAMVRNQVQNMVFSSTAAVYGQRDDRDLLNEDAPKLPINPYGHSKWMVECLLRDLATSGELNAIALRYFNAAGSDPKGRIGERHDPETHLIPLIMDAARGKRPNIKIFGTDYPTPDGTCIRDYIHVTDLAEAHVRAVELLLDDARVGKETGRFDAMNLGTSNGYSVREVIEATKRITDVDFEVIEQERRAGDPARLVADASKAKKVLDWEPERSDLETLLRDTWAFRRLLH